MEIKPYQTASLGVARVEVTKLEMVEGEPKEIKQKYHLVLDFNALALAMEKTGLDFAYTKSWQNLSPGNLLALCWCAFQRFHPEVTQEEVGRMLAPADRWTIWDALMELAHPGLIAELEKAVKEKQLQGPEGESEGEAQPAAGSAAS